jgi:hypothetical protein
MKLLTKKLEKRFKEVGSQEIETTSQYLEVIVLARFFDSIMGFNWYATQYDPYIRQSC